MTPINATSLTDQIPACWTWDLPPLPQPCDFAIVTTWQAGRCAVCGRRRRRLQEDHDHGTGNTRGYLCASCNVKEGVWLDVPAFQRYRERPPAVLLGVLRRYQRGTHPDIAEADAAWGRALADLHILQSPAEQDYLRREVEFLRSQGVSSYPAFVLPEWTPLMRHAARVGLTVAEWRASIEHRETGETAAQRAERFRNSMTGVV